MSEAAERSPLRAPLRITPRPPSPFSRVGAHFYAPDATGTAPSSARSLIARADAARARRQPNAAQLVAEALEAVETALAEFDAAGGASGEEADD